jgi:hypothetical protein
MASSALSDRGRAASAGPGFALAVVALSIPLFALGMVVHESLHAVAVLLLGSHPVLVLRPWALQLLPLSITGIHVAPEPALDPTRQFLDNLLGPGVAAILFGLVALRLTHGAFRWAAIATVLGLAFYAFIESADVVLDGRVELGFLTAPEFNYGMPLLIACVVAAIAARRRGT